MKLLFLVTEDWYFVSHRLPLALAAQAAGYEVAVATRVSRHADTITQAGIRLIPFSLSRRAGNPLREIQQIVRLYRHERPDIVHHVALKPVVYGAIAARLAGVPAQVHAVAGLGWLFSSRSLLARVIRPLARRLLAALFASRQSRVIVQNADDAAFLGDAGVGAGQLRLIRGAGVDMAAFRPAAAAPVGKVCVLLASRMIREKGIAAFVAAAERLHGEGLEARFLLAGEPDPGNPAALTAQQLEAWSQAGIVEWLGRRDDMPEVIGGCHIFCLPTSYGEGIPKVLLEAAACGKPIVTTDTPGCREVVTDGDNGLLVSVSDVGALVQALRRLILDAPLRERMGRRGRERAEREFAQDQVIRQTLDVYRELQAP